MSAPDNHLIYTKDVLDLSVIEQHHFAGSQGEVKHDRIFTVVAMTHDGQRLNASSWRTEEAAERVLAHYWRQVENGNQETILVPPTPQREAQGTEHELA